ncbi:TAXI family TRAP transporter solute-binding subunit [Shumkonia mesophila]|uniref:TAXI family TRAP transporter solute-binding subunit n=1 Tax=Shumkonia mesophila TaxID=2838854 RepID=UPI0029341FE4|nr:TAXI family TRAP transporter solute-binding subunit [Shumkonia mesophila]
MRKSDWAAKAVGAIAAMGLCASQAVAGDFAFINIATASTSGSYYPAGLAMSKLINDKLGVRASAQASAGSVENVSLLRNKEANMGIIQSNVVRDALKGDNNFKSKPYTDMVVLAPLFVNTDHILIRKGANIASLADIKGKRWAVGSVGSGTTLSNLAILSGAGYTFNDIKVEYLGQTEALAALQNGIIDGADLTSGVPFSQMEQTRISEKDDLVLYSMTEAEQKSVVENSGWKSPETIPANTYSNQPTPIRTVSHLALIMVPKEMPDKLAFDILDAMNKNMGQLRQAHSAFSTLDLATALPKIEALKFPLHPGATKFFASINK